MVQHSHTAFLIRSLLSASERKRWATVKRKNSRKTRVAVRRLFEQPWRQYCTAAGACYAMLSALRSPQPSCHQARATRAARRPIGAARPRSPTTSAIRMRSVGRGSNVVLPPVSPLALLAWPLRLIARREAPLLRHPTPLARCLGHPPTACRRHGTAHAAREFAGPSS